MPVAPPPDYKVGQALAKQALFGKTEEFLARALQTVNEERNVSEQEETSNIVGLNETRPYAREASPRIHILGTGRVGKFIAHSLAGLADPPPITLLSRRRDIIRLWELEGKTLDLITGNTSHRRSGIELRYIATWGSQEDQSELIIDKLIVTTRANELVPALLRVKERLLPSSTICFLQDSMGIIDDVNTLVFPNPAARPHYIVGIGSHSLKDQRGRYFTTIYYKPGNTYLAKVPNDNSLWHQKYRTSTRQIDQKLESMRISYVPTTSPSSSQTLMRSLTRCLILSANGLQYDDVFQMQLERLAVNAVLGPLSVVFDCTNGDLQEHNQQMRELMGGLLGEIVEVVQNLPELQKAHGFKNRFIAKRLKRLILWPPSGRNEISINSMLQDVRKAWRTDIDFINGYIVKRGLELGILCPVNTTVIQMVKAKTAMNQRKERSFIGFIKS